MANAQHAPYAQQSGPYTAQTYQRKDEHKARTGNDHEESYVLTLHTDEEHHKSMTALRKRYFPPNLNKLDAHIALFRALPGSQLPRITQDVTSLAASQSPFSINANEAFRMRQGVGIQVVDQSGQAKSIFEKLKQQWKPFLSQQDHSFRAHYTVQNKVENDETVNRTLKELEEQFQGSRGQVLGLTLYKYDRGHWKKEQDYSFGGRH
ncbi:hypothetical protein H2200_012977 [Cladophialophora chaetospira]|uniref:Uncharacterized protein n=1 Tax=Cladophialophora chaetospira TaxID=386627 RepID=A0AA39CBP6_9EURO|nr:hypothetical protein H2200_012977 [Cladophialophora chaetospira]